MSTRSSPAWYVMLLYGVFPDEIIETGPVQFPPSLSEYTHDMFRFAARKKMNNRPEANLTGLGYVQPDPPFAGAKFRVIVFSAPQLPGFEASVVRRHLMPVLS